MLMNQTIDKLNHMKFFGMVKGLEEQAASLVREVGVFKLDAGAAAGVLAAPAHPGR